MRGRHYGGVFLLSAATLLLELALMRVLSVANWYHFGFLIISTALLAFGASGVALTLCRKLFERASLDRTLSALSLAFGIVAVASYWLMQRIPFDPFDLLVDRRQLIFIPLYYVVAGAPFFCSGLAIGLLLSRGGPSVNRLYAADLIGAGLGCAAIALVTPIFGGAGSVVAAAVLGFAAASLFGSVSARGLAATSIVLAVVAIPFAFAADHVMPISVIAAKRHSLQPLGSNPIYTAWNAFSRVDVFDLPANPSEGRPDAGFSIIVDAGASGTAIADLGRGARNYLAESTKYRPTGIAYAGKPHPKVLIIGSGAGREVLEAEKYGAQSITAVEINPIIADIVTERMRSSWGGLFEAPEVTLVTEDGRSFIRRSKEKYDVVISIQTMTDAAVTSGALTMSETYLFTREAMGDYLDHLTPNGVILITRPPSQITKLFATLREVFEERGLGSPAKYLVAFQGPLAPYGHALFNNGLLFKKSPWTAEELQAVTDRLGVGHPEQWFGQSPKIFYSPLQSEGRAANGYSRELDEILSAPDLHAACTAQREQLCPATDDRPFFNQTVRWASLRPHDFLQIFGAGKQGNIVVQPVAEVMLVTMLVQAIVVAFILILLPLARFASQGLRVPRPTMFITYFAGLGLGFIMIEIVMIQRFMLFLGQPVYTFAVVLAGLLMFTGIGSFLVSRIGDGYRRALIWIVPSILTVLSLTAVASPWLLASAVGLPLAWRIVLVVAMLAPLGILLGMPFPIGLRIVGDDALAFVPWAWGVNGLFTVIGSIGASILGMAFGFTAVLGISAACYLAALVAIIVANRPVSAIGPNARVLVGRTLKTSSPAL